MSYYAAMFRCFFFFLFLQSNVSLLKQISPTLHFSHRRCCRVETRAQQTGTRKREWLFKGRPVHLRACARLFLAAWSPLSIPPPEREKESDEIQIVNALLMQLPSLSKAGQAHGREGLFYMQGADANRVQGLSSVHVAKRRQTIRWLWLTAAALDLAADQSRR